VKLVIKTFDYIHSVDSLKLAQCISQHSKEIGKTQKILLQVNNANEEQKFGFSKNTLFEVFQQIVKLDNIEVVGVMNMAPLGEDESKLNRLFSDIRQIRDELNRRFGCDLKEISMGMSQDYKIAAIQGSTMLRIGRKLFT
jgi:pyridoxal phosphate enzyme (YggS family)